MDDELDFERWESAVGKIVMSLSRVEGELLMKYQSHFSKTKYFNEVQDIHHYVHCLLVIGLMAYNLIDIDQDDGCPNLSGYSGAIFPNSG